MKRADMDKKKIIVVDDDRDLLDVLRVRLETSGYAVQCADSGAVLFKLLKKQKPDLIVLDIMMPEVDGLEVLRRLRASDETSQIPVLLLTARFQYEDVLSGYALGATHYVTKPFTTKQLLGAIGLALRGGASKKPVPLNQWQ